MNKVLFFAHLRDAVGEESIEYNANGILLRNSNNNF